MAEESHSSGIPVASSTERQLVITRSINAPRELVFQAWTHPEHLVHWWGPRGFTTPVCEMDVRPGGTFRITLRSPEGENYRIKGVYHEIVAPERLVYTNGWDEAGRPGQESLVTVTFADEDGRTKLAILTEFASAADFETFKGMGVIEGWTESLERLAGHLAKA
ncbi:MAG: SRPBCC domain-containing protein [Gemmatimonadales bacterium]